MTVRRLFPVLWILVTSSPVHAASGTEGASFLAIPVGARPAALGSAYGPLATDVYATVWNPAGLGFIPSIQLSAQHLNYVESIDYEYLGAAVPFRPGSAVGISVQYLRSGDIASTDNNGQSIGDFSSHFAAYSLAFGHRITEHIALGAAAKWIHEKIGDFSADTFGGSFGGMLRLEKALRVSAVVDNFGGQLTFLNQSDPLPLTGRLGVAYDPAKDWTLSLEGRHMQSGLSSAHTGIEWRPLSMLALRTGYRTDTLEGLSALAGCSAGVGFNIWNQEWSYAWLPLADLGNTHYLSFVLRFNERGDQQRNLIEFRSVTTPRVVRNYFPEFDPDPIELMDLIDPAETVVSR